MARFSVAIALLGFLQLSFAVAATIQEDKFEPMVAFICERPAMHRGVKSWIPDRSTDCLDRMEDILAYCQKVYPDHNISNVVEASYLVTIPDWPMKNSNRLLPHRIRPFRCLVGGFQSDALLVPRHCEFDHRHDQSQCEAFSHWNLVADDACHLKGYRLESFGMLLICDIGRFSGVEYVCCPNKTDSTELNPPVYHPPQEDDKPDFWHGASDSEDDDGDVTTSSNTGGSSDVDELIQSTLNEETIDLYEAYLRGEPFPSKFNNEHKKFIAAKQRMKQNQQLKVTKLLQEWQTAREHVDEIRTNNPEGAERLAQQITERFQNLYSAYESENNNELEQLIGVHLQHVQAIHNDRKRRTMDTYLRALESENADDIMVTLRAYIEAEEKDRMHTVNHYEHVKANSPREALRIHPFIVNHLKLSEQRIDQALEMLSRFPQIEEKIKPEIAEFMVRFNAIAKSISENVLPMPEVEDESDSSSESDSWSSEDNSMSSSSDSFSDSNSNSESDSTGDDFDLPVGDSNESNSLFDDSADAPSDESLSSESVVDDDDDDDVRENEHDYEKQETFARRLNDGQAAQQGLHKKSVRNTQVGSTVAFALGGVSFFVIILVAVVMMIRRRNNTQFVSHSYVEVDPNAPQEERHIANMQMNGYENPTYMYFEASQPQNPTA